MELLPTVGSSRCSHRMAKDPNEKIGMNNFTIVEPYGMILTPAEEIRDFPRRLEVAGRTCYKSEKNLTPDSADRFIRMIMKSGHHSVIEHCSITARIVGDRSMSHQLVRHRLASYSQESQRYCNYGKKGLEVILPPSIGSNDRLKTLWADQINDSYQCYLWLLEGGTPPEDARSVLPNATKTEVVTTFNLRQWRWVLKERALNPHAQWQIKGIMQGLLRSMFELAPVIFEDLILELEQL